MTKKMIKAEASTDANSISNTTMTKEKIKAAASTEAISISNTTKKIAMAPGGVTRSSTKKRIPAKGVRFLPSRKNNFIVVKSSNVLGKTSQWAPLKDGCGNHTLTNRDPVTSQKIVSFRHFWSETDHHRSEICILTCPVVSYFLLSFYSFSHKTV
jgi:hypothetical protein